jgi:hypothetical protein
MKISKSSITSALCKVLLPFMLIGCKKRHEITDPNALFVLVPPDSSGIDFINRITPDDTTS